MSLVFNWSLTGFSPVFNWSLTGFSPVFNLKKAQKKDKP